MKNTPVSVILNSENKKTFTWVTNMMTEARVNIFELADQNTLSLQDRCRELKSGSDGARAARLASFKRLLAEMKKHDVKLEVIDED